MPKERLTVKEIEDEWSRAMEKHTLTRDFSEAEPITIPVEPKIVMDLFQCPDCEHGIGLAKVEHITVVECAKCGCRTVPKFRMHITMQGFEKLEDF